MDVIEPYTIVDKVILLVIVVPCLIGWTIVLIRDAKFFWNGFIHPEGCADFGINTFLAFAALFIEVVLMAFVVGAALTPTR